MHYFGKTSIIFAIDVVILTNGREMKLINILICALMLLSCSQKKGPEGVLKSYIDKRFSSGIDKEEFSEFFGGTMLEDLETVDESVVGKMNKIKDYKKTSFTVNFKKCTEQKCFLTYTLSFDAKAEAGETEKKVAVKVKKVAELQKENKTWKIHDISDVKTHFDYK